ncbi:MAG: 5'/3'-nucleotidase SurE [Candidatus Rokubacteria bacterium]|nr:5'/3'-nucleotidase SurE [Candidatus Rokubacteria bacterium]
MRARGRPNILISNDDGIHAPGLAALAATLDAVGEVYVVAPDRERSAVGHALTLHRPLRVESLGPRRFAVNGTPTDCVNLAILGILPVRPDVVVAGINDGSNLGDDVTYSGTVSAAMEGSLLGVPALAVSLVQAGEGADYTTAAQAAAELTQLLLRDRESGVTLVNVNVPRGKPRGLKMTRLGRRVYSEKVTEQRDPRGRVYYWIGAGPPAWEAGEDTDFAAVHAGYISVTPLHLDLTSYDGLRAFKAWETDFGRSGTRRRVSSALGSRPGARESSSARAGRRGSSRRARRG